jgi:TPR repeat protein
MKKILLFVMLLTIYTSAGTIEETRRSCEAGDAKSCKIMGDLTRAGLGVEQNRTKAQNYYDIACFYGDRDACKELEVMQKD